MMFLGAITDKKLFSSYYEEEYVEEVLGHLPFAEYIDVSDPGRGRWRRARRRSPPKKQVLLGREKLFEQPINQLPILLLNHMPPFFESIRQLFTNRKLMLEEIDLLQLFVRLKTILGL